MGTKTQLILQALADAEGPVPLADVVSAVGDDDEGADARTKAMLGYLAKQSMAESAGRGVGWVITQHGRDHLHALTRDAGADEPPATPVKAARAAKPTAPAEQKAPRKARAVAVVPARPAVKPPGSVAVADDGTVLLLEGDRIAARITAQQAANIAALVSRYQAG